MHTIQYNATYNKQFDTGVGITKIPTQFRQLYYTTKISKLKAD